MRTIFVIIAFLAIIVVEDAPFVAGSICIICLYLAAKPKKTRTSVFYD